MGLKTYILNGLKSGEHVRNFDFPKKMLLHEISKEMGSMTRKFELVKVYPSYALYKNCKTGLFECFNYSHFVTNNPRFKIDVLER